MKPDSSTSAFGLLVVSALAVCATMLLAAILLRALPEGALRDNLFLFLVPLGTGCAFWYGFKAIDVARHPELARMKRLKRWRDAPGAQLVIKQIALGWETIRRRDGFTPQQQREFDHWLAEAPEHAEAAREAADLLDHIKTDLSRSTRKDG